MPVVGILGGIGSGKSSVVRQVCGFRLQIIDADGIGHERLQDPEIQAQIRTHFGNEAFAVDGTVNRSRLAQLVFGQEPQHETARKQLNSILHPAIRREIHLQIDAAFRDVEAVILDAALLLEGGWDATCDWLIYIDTPQRIREERVLQNRGWSAAELARREATQLSLEIKKNRAHFVVDNSGSLAQAAHQMQQVFHSILKRNA